MGARKQADLTPEQYAVADSLYDLPRLSVFQTPDEIHKAMAKCADFIRAGNHFRAHRDMEHVWKILSSSARRSLQARLEQRASSRGSWPE